LYFFAIMIVVAKFHCTTALLKCRRCGLYCYSILYYLPLLTAALTAAISIAEITYSAIFVQKMRRTAVAAAPTAEAAATAAAATAAAATAAATAAAATAAAAAVSYRLYDYLSLQCNYKPQPRRSGRHELVVLFSIKFSMSMPPELPPPRPPPRPSINYTLFCLALPSLAIFYHSHRRHGRRRDRRRDRRRGRRSVSI
jgi:hypothetical protein